MPFELPPLPYPMDALEPHISKETLEYHYGKHHAAYVNNLNKLVEGKEEASKSLEDLIKTSSGGILNNAGQAYNHSFYWRCMKPGGGGLPPSVLLSEIEKSYKTFDKFKEEFSLAASGHFGSGWIWLCYCKKNKKVEIKQTHDGAVPFSDSPDCIPLLTCDVWEHAYYIDRRNNRAAYVQAWWELVNWDFASENLKKAME